MAILGINDLKQWALPTYWDASYLSKLKLASGETYETWLNDVASALAEQNAQLLNDPLIGSLISVTSDVAVEYPVGVSNGFEDHTEYGRPDAQRATTTGHMLELKELFEAGEVTPVIDRRYTLSELPEALRHYGTGHARGKIVITI